MKKATKNTRRHLLMPSFSYFLWFVNETRNIIKQNDFEEVKMMDILVTDKILNLLMIATTFSTILMALIQQIKNLSIVTNSTHILIINFCLSFLGILFGMSFYDLTIVDGIWVSLFSFIGAPTIYQLLKKQNVINYTPKSLNECRGCVTIKSSNVIDRGDGVK
jgi:hypothetical protein